MYNNGAGGSGGGDDQPRTDAGNHNNGFIGGGGGYGFGGGASAAPGGRGSDYPTGRHPHHQQLTMHRQWYDEPLYANDTEEFYMFGGAGGRDGSAGGGGMQGRRTLQSRREQRNGVISLRSAGDISLPQNGNCRPGNGRTNSQHKYQGNGDYSGSVSDIQSVTSRMSSVSVSEREKKMEKSIFTFYFAPSNLLLPPDFPSLDWWQQQPQFY